MKRLAMFILGGGIFGAGLAVSGMTQPEVVLSFLLFDDFGLALVMAAAIGVTLPVFRWWRKPLLAATVQGFKAWLDPRTVLGSVLFGIGWGLSGVCPGAAFASLGTFNGPVAVAVAMMFVGGYLQGAWIGDRKR